MTSLAEIRQKYPQYKDVPDIELADALHAKFYADMPKARVYDRLGLKQAAKTQDIYSNRDRGVSDQVLANLGVGDEVSGAAAFVNQGARNLINRARGKDPELSARDAFGIAAQAERDARDQYAEQNPGRNTLATATGILAFAPSRAAGATNMAIRPMTAARDAATIGAPLGFLGADGDLQDRTVGAAIGGGVGAVLGAGAQKLLGPSTTKAKTPQRILLDEGVDLTPGQIAGGAGKRTEDALTSIPIAGDIVKSGQNRSIETFNKSVINRALKPLGRKLPKDVKAGYDAIGYADDALGEAYNRLLPKLKVVRDADFDQSIDNILERLPALMPEQQANQVKEVLRQNVLSSFDDVGRMTGKQWKAAESELSRLSRGYGKSQVQSERELAGVLRDIRGSMRDLLQRSNPEQAKRLSKINEGYANLITIERAATSTGAQEGVFTPAQLKNAVKATDFSVRKKAFARGDALLQDIADAGKTVLPQKMGDSGTASRAMAGYAATGGLGFVNPVAAAATGMATIPYTPFGMTGLNALARMTAPRLPQTAAPILNPGRLPVYQNQIPQAVRDLLSARAAAEQEQQGR